MYRAETVAGDDDDGHLLCGTGSASKAGILCVSSASAWAKSGATAYSRAVAKAGYRGRSKASARGERPNGGLSYRSSSGAEAGYWRKRQARAHGGDQPNG